MIITTTLTCVPRALPRQVVALSGEPSQLGDAMKQFAVNTSANNLVFTIEKFSVNRDRGPVSLYDCTCTLSCQRAGAIQPE
ncbi:hypothetical protein H8K47_15965 [Undibacterium sp. CY7W]|uniref:Uncharacterized protein n=1 Tax=Undibacterium rugosum TaxID=2762291 RepID=A0A923L0H2_9BURK|nr:hypothetical protein [Undibacterium rugosum]MBC3936861.1 hypothetical protein [Undibacterium rugosum]